jgi:hypothetical protein
MKRHLPLISVAAGAAFSLLAASPALSATVTYVTPTGSTTSGGPVDAQAVFTTGTNSISLTLTDLLANPTNVAQAISDISFTLSGGLTVTGAMLTSSSGQEITVNDNGTFSLGAPVSTGWALSTSGSTLTLDVLGTATAPEHLIIGPPGSGGTYSNANGSIAGNDPHNPFLNQSATFNIFLSGVSSNTSVTSALFSFGTTPGIDDVPGVISTTTGGGGAGATPIPAGLPLFASGAGVLGYLGWRRKRKPAALAA